MGTSIEWTSETWNFLSGCQAVSSGCLNCYAERMAERLKAMDNPRYRNGFEFTIHEDKLDLPTSWKKPRQVFVNSMSDLFHPKAPEGLIHRAFQVMTDVDRHVYQLLTKRANRLADVGPSLPWGPHMWAGVSVENKERVGSSGYCPTDRIDDLRRCGADTKWVSAEPLIGPLPNLNLGGIDWVVVGGESGPIDDIREMKLGWVRDIIAQCRAQDTAVFVKQLGTVWGRENGLRGKAGDPSKWPEDLRIREQPDVLDDQPELA
jgi:protein gp37